MRCRFSLGLLLCGCVVPLCLLLSLVATAPVAAQVKTKAATGDASSGTVGGEDQGGTSPTFNSVNGSKGGSPAPGQGNTAKGKMPLSAFATPSPSATPLKNIIPSSASGTIPPAETPEKPWVLGGLVLLIGLLSGGIVSYLLFAKRENKMTFGQEQPLTAAGLQGLLQKVPQDVATVVKHEVVKEVSKMDGNAANLLTPKLDQIGQQVASVGQATALLKPQMEGVVLVNTEIVQKLDRLETDLRSRGDVQEELARITARSTELEEKLRKSEAEYYDGLRHSEPSFKEAHTQLRDLLPLLMGNAGRVATFTRDLTALADSVQTQSSETLMQGQVGRMDALVFGPLPSVNREALVDAPPLTGTPFLPTLLQVVQIGLAQQLKEKHGIEAFAARTNDKIDLNLHELALEAVTTDDPALVDTVDATLRIGYKFRGAVARKAVVRRRVPAAIQPTSSMGFPGKSAEPFNPTPYSGGGIGIAHDDHR